MVPVLSKTIFFTLANSSILLPPLIKIPSFAALPIPAIIAVGVASPIAQGQEITKTAMLLINAFWEEMSKPK